MDGLQKNGKTDICVFLCLCVVLMLWVDLQLALLFVVNAIFSVYLVWCH